MKKLLTKLSVLMSVTVTATVFSGQILPVSAYEGVHEYSIVKFNPAFLMSANADVNYRAMKKPLNKENYEFTFTTIDGKSVNTSAQGRPKVLVFFSSSCNNSRETIISIANSDLGNTDVICINALSSGDEEATKNFRDTYGNNNMEFCAYADVNDTAMWTYADDIPSYTNNRIYWPVIAYIDANNKLQMVTSGYSDAVRDYINYYCGATNNAPEHSHVYSDVWSKDEQSHWHACVADGCDGSVEDKAAHTAGEWIVDKSATVSEEGSRHKECTVCGYIMQTESISKLNPEPSTPSESATSSQPSMPSESATPSEPEMDMDESTSEYYDITINGGTWNGTHYYLPSGRMVTNAFFSDGTYTYYLQADGTPMRDILTYHPDGVHIIYFDINGHEVFSSFAHISKNIQGEAVDDICFFDSYGYMYVDTLTYDNTGTKLYYINALGVVERNGWFEFSGHEFDSGFGFTGVAGGYGYANWDGSLMVNTYTYDWNENLVYMQANGHMAQ